MKNHIYLDYNASAPLRPEARDAMQAVLSLDGAAYNASSVHGYGRAGRKIVEQARAHVAALLNVPSNQVVFNSGATEGNNTVLRHFSARFPDAVILVSAIEHPSVLEARNLLPNVRVIPVDSNGCLDLDALEGMLQSEDVCLVSCMMVNNETGVIQDVRDIADRAHRHGALFHCDAVQAVGRIEVDMVREGIDFLTLSSHKIGGPQGVGALVVRLCGQDPVLLFGGGQEKGRRPGTENVSAIASFGAAARVAADGIKDYRARASLRDRMEREIQTISPHVVFHARDVPRVANTSFFSIPGGESQTLLMALDLEGIAVSNGSACSSGTVRASSVLQAMGCDEKLTSGALRISMGWATKDGDVDAFVDAWRVICKRIGL